MQGQALLQIPGENPGWLEALQVPQYALDVAERAVHAIGNLVQIDPQVTRLVEVFHQGEGNHAVGRIVQLDVDLADDAVAQRLFGGQPVLKIKILTAFKAAAAAAAPVFKGDRRPDLRVGGVIPPLPVVVNQPNGLILTIFTASQCYLLRHFLCLWRKERCIISIQLSRITSHIFILVASFAMSPLPWLLS